MWQYKYSDELYHRDVKGMKWGVRRYQNSDGSLTSKGVKKYAQKGYAKDAYNSNKTRAGQIYDRYTGAHKITGKMQYKLSSDEQNRARAEKYAKENNKPASQKVAKALATVGKAYLTDQLFLNGMGTKAVNSAVKYTGRALVTSFVAARGGHDIRWYD